MKFNGRGILLDVEGTTSSIRFVYDQMFPFVRRELTAFLSRSFGESDVAKACSRIAEEAGNPQIAQSADRVQAEVIRLMDTDAKTTGLKELQGLIWKSGFESGELKSHVYPDVVPAITSWRERGLDLRIYSSGSITAQKLFFGHTEEGDLLACFSGHYDTTIGAKREVESYKRIAADWNFLPTDLLFLSDVVAELDAAREAQYSTALLLRPGNKPQPDAHGHFELHSFAEVETDRK